MAATAHKHVVENANVSMLETGHPSAAKHTKQGSVRERRAKNDRDNFYVSDKDREKYGVKPEEKLAWARNPQIWAEHEKSDRLEQLCDSLENGGKEARVIYKNGEFDKVTLGDLVLVAIPEEVAADDQAMIDEANFEFEKPLRAVRTAEYRDKAVRSHQHILAETGEEYDPNDLSRMYDMARAESEFNHQTGLIGGNSPTAGMTLMEAENFMKNRQEELERKQEILRMGGSHTALDPDAFFKVMMGGEKKVKMLFGDTGLGKTTAQKLAARGKGA